MQTYTVRLRERGQMTIPQAAREHLSVKEGDTLTLMEYDGLLLVVTRQPLIPRLSAEFSRQMDEAGVSLADLLAGLDEERRASRNSRQGSNA